MGWIREAVSRLRTRSEIEKELEEMSVGTEFHLPLFETEEKQRLRQAPDREDLYDELYATPNPADVRFEHENQSYRIESVSVREKNSILYKLKRALGKADFQGWVEISIDTGENPLPAGLTEHPHYEVMDTTIRYRFRDTEATLTYEFEDIEQIGGELYVFNRILSSCWEQPETISELREGIQKWEMFNQFREQAR